MSFPDGSIFEGDFNMNEIHGHGVYLYADRRKYNGELVNGMMHGRGHLINPDGTQYIGEFQLDKRHGQGKFIWYKGREYEGGWVRGK